MSILHSVNKSPFNQNTLMQCLDIIDHNHALILIEDGCYGALKSSPAIKTLQDKQEQGLQVYALTDDINTRGLSDNLLETITLIDMAEFVELCCNYSSTQSWY